MKKERNNTCCDEDAKPGGKYKLESIVTIDDRGQMVLPKEVRDRMCIKSGDKFALVVMEWRGEPCCITLMKTDDIATMVTDFLGPITDNMVKKVDFKHSKTGIGKDI